MKQFKSAGQAQRFLSAHDQINNLFYLRRDHVTAADSQLLGRRGSTSGPKSAVAVGDEFFILSPVTPIQLTRCDKLTVPGEHPIAVAA